VSSVLELNKEDREWVDTTFAALSADEKIGQVINVTIGWGIKNEAEFLDRIEHFQPGSGQGGTGAWRDCRALLEKIQERASIPFCTSADAENGVNCDGATAFPSGMGRAAVADIERAEELTYLAGKVAAVQGRAVGICWDLAPVVDVNANFRNPITNIRSYGDDVPRIKRLTAAFIRGVQDHGMAATAKHFPGDGYSDLDQHKITTANPLSRDEWFRNSGAVFKNAIDTGVLTIMPGHIACPALDPARNERGRPIPATFSRVLLEDVLRGELGFTGLIVSDAFGMGGCQEHEKTIPSAVVRGLAAGLDVALMVPPPELEATFDAIRRALDDGSLPEERLDEAARRVLSLKARLGLHKADKVVPAEEEAAKVYEPGIHRDEALEAARLSITLTHDLEGTLPLDASTVRRVLINLLNEEQFWGADGIKLFGNRVKKLHCADELRRRGIDVDVVEDPGEGETIQAMDRYDAIIYMFNTGPQASRCSISPCRQALRDIDWRVINSDKPVVFVALRSPYIRYYLPGIPNLICTYGNSEAQQVALAEAVMGEVEFQGKAPVELPEEHA
jgi:beta-N-acetylhexosaminidase